jgi:hypothetical protein
MSVLFPPSYPTKMVQDVHMSERASDHAQMLRHSIYHYGEILKADSEPELESLSSADRLHRLEGLAGEKQPCRFIKFCNFSDPDGHLRLPILLSVPTSELIRQIASGDS